MMDISKIDPADFNVITGAFKSVAQEMQDILLRSAYSSIVREAKDCSTCVMDASARTVAQAEAIPIHMNSLAAVVPAIRAKYDLDNLRPNDAFLTNNPYENGQHLNDIIFILPVFHNDRLVAFTGTICHHLEVGGAVAGSNANATDLYQEGLIIPTMKINVERDLDDGPVEQMISANVRLPDTIIGDFHAQISAAMRGRGLICDLIDRHGLDLIAACMAGLQDYSEKMLRATIAKLPDGEYFGEDTLDSQFLDGDQPVIRARVVINGDTAMIDMSDSDDQVAWPVNAPVASTQSAVLTVFGLLAGAGVPTNDGIYRPIEIKTRKGSVLDPHHPAPVRGRMSSAYRTGTAVKRALAGAAPELFSAAGNDTTNTVTMSCRDESGPDGGGLEMFAEIIMGGNGAGPHNDGAEVVAQMLSNTGNTPVEAIEMDQNFVRVLDYVLIADSGGAGRQRGGLGVRRSYDILKDNVLISTNSDRHDSAPWGLMGGLEPDRTTFTIFRDNQAIRVPGASNIECRKGDRFTIEICGGGGYGEPRDRDRDAVRDDVRCGRVTEQAAIDVYGLESLV
ncbi:MAG: hydantoinase B/oxoprolinase family protein [Rhodospirillaceae bacterium]|jgi:N-methylhydantoinase B|nr:hydantoinase B/oxoprolinase family protein [Rhodospirillaceae bacterium]